MKWIALAIVVYIGGYTFINIAYRKPAGSAHEPAVDARERSLRTVHTTLNGWVRLSASLAPTRAIEASTRATVAETPRPEPLDRALPPDLPPIVPGLPSLHSAALTLHAPATAAGGEPLRIDLDFPVDASVPAFGEVLAYAKDNHLYVFIQDAKRTAPGQAPTPPTAPLTLVLPSGAFSTGPWQVSLFTAATAFTWSFTVE
jgi:hypothetical protein